MSDLIAGRARWTTSPASSRAAASATATCWARAAVGRPRCSNARELREQFARFFDATRQLRARRVQRLPDARAAQADHPRRRALAALPAQPQRTVRSAPGAARSVRFAVAVPARHGGFAHPGGGGAWRRPRGVRERRRCGEARWSRCATSTATASPPTLYPANPNGSPDAIAGLTTHRRPRDHPDAASGTHVAHGQLQLGAARIGATTVRGCGSSATRGSGWDKGWKGPARSGPFAITTLARALFLKMKFATCVLPSANLSCNWRHEPAHALSVFQT